MNTQPHIIHQGASYKQYIVISPEDRHVRLIEGLTPNDIRHEVVLTPDCEEFESLPQFWQDYVRLAWRRMGVTDKDS